MTYTRTWSSKIPSGSRAGDLFDDSMREIRTDIGERGETLAAHFNGSWSSDPIATTITKYQYMHWSAFRPITNASAISFNTGGNHYTIGVAGEYDNTLYNHGVKVVDGGGAAVTMSMYRRLLLPSVCTLVDVDIVCGVAQASSSVAGSVVLINTDSSTVTSTSLASRTLSNPTTQGSYSLSSGANINQTLDDSHQFVFVKVDLTTDTGSNPSFGFQGIRVRYSAAPLRYV